MWGIEYATQKYFDFIEERYGDRYFTMSQTSKQDEEPSLLIRGTNVYDTNILNIVLGILSPENYGKAEMALSEDSINQLKENTLYNLYLPFTDNEYAADYNYSQDFDEAGVEIITNCTITDTVQDYLK